MCSTVFIISKLCEIFLIKNQKCQKFMSVRKWMMETMYTAELRRIGHNIFASRDLMPAIIDACIIILSF